jgi:hypothetical protein
VLFAGRIGGGNRWQQEMATVSRGERYDSFGTAVTILAETFSYLAFRQQRFNMAGLFTLASYFSYEE